MQERFEIFFSFFPSAGGMNLGFDFDLNLIWILILIWNFDLEFDLDWILVNLPELKCERLVCSFSGSESSGLLRESPISGLGHVSMVASSAIFN